MKDNFLKDSYLHNIKRQYEAFTPYLHAHKERVIIGAFVVLAVFFYLCVNVVNRKYTNDEAGYEVTGPLTWQMKIAADKLSVKYFKKNKKGKKDNSTIKVYHVVGNSFGGTPLDYIVNGLVPQAKYLYEIKEGTSIDFREVPYLVERKGREWAATSFYINHEDLQEIYVTQNGDYVIIVILNAPEEQQREDQKVLNKTVNSMKFSHYK